MFVVFLLSPYRHLLRTPIAGLGPSPIREKVRQGRPKLRPATGSGQLRIPGGLLPTYRHDAAVSFRVTGKSTHACRYGHSRRKAGSWGQPVTHGHAPSVSPLAHGSKKRVNQFGRCRCNRFNRRSRTRKGYALRPGNWMRDGDDAIRRRAHTPWERALRQSVHRRDRPTNLNPGPVRKDGTHRGCLSPSLSVCRISRQIKHAAITYGKSGANSVG